MADEKYTENDSREESLRTAEEEFLPENAEHAEECAPVPDVTKGDDPGWLGCGMSSVPHVVPSREQSVFVPEGELPDKFVIAERSGWTALGPIILWTAAVVGAAVFVMSLVFPSDTKGISVYAGVLTGIFFIVAICYTAFCADIPRTLALYEEGKIVLWITKKKRVRLDPSEIVFISQRNYNAWYRSGKLIVESVKGKFTLSMVADVDGARRRMELARSSDVAVLVPVESEDE